MLSMLLLMASLPGLKGVRTPWDEDTLGGFVVEAFIGDQEFSPRVTAEEDSETEAI